MSAQRFQNAACVLPTEGVDEAGCSDDFITHCSSVSSSDGYRPHAMLFVDERFADHRVQRDSDMSVLSFRPVVRFCSTHYRYVRGSPYEPYRIVQVGIGADEQLDGLGFRVPSPRGVAAETAQNLHTCAA